MNFTKSYKNALINAVKYIFYRSCSLNNIYLLVRPKENKDPQTRLREMFSSSVSCTTFQHAYL